MTYFDTAFIAKCYLPEPGAERIRLFARERGQLACCELGRLEFFSAIRRHQREGRMDAATSGEIWREFLEDEARAVWRWLALNTSLLERAREKISSLPESFPLRTADAIHLTCAQASGNDEIFSNDLRLLAAAPHFGLRGVNLLD